MTIPKRRGRPTKIAAAQPLPVQEPVNAEIAAAPEVTGEPVKRRRRASVGGFHMKLALPQRPGFHRHWFNDTPAGIAKADELAYVHISDPDIKSDNPGGPVRRLVGTQANGQPLYAYAMETPLEEYQRGQDEREEIHRQVDEAISDGRAMDKGRISNEYGEGSIRSG